MRNGSVCWATCGRRRCRATWAAHVADAAARVAQTDNPPAEPASGALAERKSLLLDTPVDELPVVDDFRWNGLANGSTTVAVVIVVAGGADGRLAGVAAGAAAVWPPGRPGLCAGQEPGLAAGWLRRVAAGQPARAAEYAATILGCCWPCWRWRRHVAGLARSGGSSGRSAGAAVAAYPGRRSGVPPGVPGVRRPAGAQSRFVAAMERRREDAGDRLPECHCEERPYAAL